MCLQRAQLEELAITARGHEGIREARVTTVRLGKDQPPREAVELVGNDYLTCQLVPFDRGSIMEVVDRRERRRVDSHPVEQFLKATELEYQRVISWLGMLVFQTRSPAADWRAILTDRQGRSVFADGGDNAVDPAHLVNDPEATRETAREMGFG